MPSFQKTLYWHDYETWGERPMVDRPAQFAGIRTDESLNIVSDPLMIYAKPAWDYLPKPEACLITGITPQIAEEKGVPEADFIRRIVAELGRPGTCGVGYNSIRFDDEVTRFTLYRNFYDAYEREWKNNNSRWDLIDVVRMMRALRPEGIEWPFYEDGTPCNKLEALSQANGLVHERAHDALSDVYATIGLAKLIREKQPKLFEYAYQLRDKRFVAKLLDVESFKPMLHTSTRFSSASLNTTLIAPLAYHPSNRNSVICFDLMQNPRDLLNLPAEAIKERLYTPKEALPDGVQRIALKEVHLNKSPMLVTPALLTPQLVLRIGLDTDMCAAHAQVFSNLTVSERASLAEKLKEVFEPTSVAIRDADVDLYNGFIGDADKALMYELRKLSEEARVKSTVVFEDARLNTLFPRYLGRNFPELLSSSQEAEWKKFCREQLINSQTGFGVKEFSVKMAHLSSSHAEGSAETMILQKVDDYVQTLFGRLDIVEFASS